MRIGLIRRGSITHLDGVNRFIANLAEAFKLLGHEVFILSWSHRGDVEELGRWFKTVHGLDIEVEVFTLRGPEDKDRWLTMLFDWFTKGGEMLKRFDADIAIVNGVVPIRFKPKIAVAHGPLVSVSRLQRSVLKLLYRTYDRVICVSEETRREYKGIVKCDRLIPLPLKLKNFKPLEPFKRANLIVHIGTRPVKNPLVSARAVEILRERGHDVELVVIGGRSEWLEREIASKKFIRLLPDVSEEEKNKVLCSAKAMVLPSSGEAFPYASLEAMACGTPPVVSYAVPDDVVVHEHTGLRVETLNPIDYANALERLLKDDELWTHIHRNALMYVKRFDHVEVAKEYLRLIKEMIKPTR
ncbi:glycosyltransferase family 4 protein [Thermofilum sp.]|uniref:glycosyltransferase family 4 protein n=1 Tax=Thermofilum sp. TaxID=1961369 RepID=UPI0031686A6C